MLRGVGHGFAVFHADEGAILAGDDVAAIGAVFVEEMAHDAEAAGHVDEIGLETDEAAHGDEGLDGDFLTVMVHVGDVGLALGEVFHGGAHGFFGNFEEKLFDGLEEIAVLVLAVNDFRAGDENFMAFAAHLLDEDGDLHFATAGDVEDVGDVGGADAEGDVGADFLLQALPDVTGGDEFAVVAGEGAVVDGELHLDGGGIDGDEGKRLLDSDVGNGFADEHFLEAGNADDVAGVGFVDFDAFEAFEVENHGDFAGGLASVTVEADGLVADFGDAAVNFAEGDTAEVIGVIEVGDEHLEALAGMGAGGGDVFDDGVEERGHGGAFVLEIGLGVAFLGAGVDDGEIELLVGGVEGDEEVENAVEDFVGLGVLAVDLVDDDDGLGAGFEGLAQDETGLGLRAVGGVDDEEDAVDHVHDALDFAAEVGVAGGVHNVDVVFAVFEGGVFGADGDALFAFQVHGVHDALLGGDGLVGAKGARLFEQAIHQRRLAVIDVGDNSDVANMIHDKRAA